MAKVFKSEEHKAGFYRLKSDYLAFCEAVNSRGVEISQLLDNIFCQFEEQCRDELLCLLDENLLEKIETDLENTDAGSIEDIIELVEKYGENQ